MKWYRTDCFCVQHQTRLCCSTSCQDRLQWIDHAVLEIINMLWCYRAWNLTHTEVSSSTFAASRRWWSSGSSHHQLCYLPLACWASSTRLLSFVVANCSSHLPVGGGWTALEEASCEVRGIAAPCSGCSNSIQDTSSYKPEEGPADQEAVMSPNHEARKIRSKLDFWT